MGGDIAVSTGPEGGARFTVTLPVETASPSRSSRERTASEKRLRVLFIDDEPCSSSES